MQLTDALSNLLGLDDGLGGVWLEEGFYKGDRPVDFTPIKSLQVHLEQLSTSHQLRRWSSIYAIGN